MKKLLACGSRDWTDRKTISEHLQAHRNWMVIEGDAPGADRIAGSVADALGMPHAKLAANWDYYGRAGGPIRNRWMLDLGPDLVLAFHPDLSKSKGTKDCVEEALRRGIKVEVIS